MAPEHAVASARLHPRGSSQGGLRQYNERVVLQAIRLHGALPAAEIARLTHLTPQTVSQISRRLLDDGLLAKGELVRGKVGQPSVPLVLAPEGAYAIGIKIGRRSMDVLLVDFTGAVRARWSTEYEFPDPERVYGEIAQRVKSIRRKLGAAGQERLAGIGVAAPLSLGGWQALLGFPRHLSEQWDRTDLCETIGQLTSLPVQSLKDTAAACVAELVAGRGRQLHSFLYLFVDTFIGGGLVIDSTMRAGPHGNAGAVGSLPLGLARNGKQEQLLSVASMLALERRFEVAGLDVTAAGDGRALQAPWRTHTRRWIADAANAIALSINCGACLLDLDGVIVDGSFSRDLLAELLKSLPAALERYSWQGVHQPEVFAGTIGSDAQALGGAWIPLHASFAPDRELFLKVVADD
ncbi:MAG TPA: ROK family transcriptional regulator [Burkholderiaceae bacterium]|nr:ROK family transcriptional regulator [Burkholderiaceae bacterium]